MSFQYTRLVTWVLLAFGLLVCPTALVLYSVGIGNIIALCVLVSAGICAMIAALVLLLYTHFHADAREDTTQDSDSSMPLDVKIDIWTIQPSEIHPNESNEYFKRALQSTKTSESSTNPPPVVLTRKMSYEGVPVIHQQETSTESELQHEEEFSRSLEHQEHFVNVEPKSHQNLGTEFSESLEHQEHFVRVEPKSHQNLGTEFSESLDLESFVTVEPKRHQPIGKEFSESLELEPFVKVKPKNYQTLVKEFRESLELEPFVNIEAKNHPSLGNEFTESLELGALVKVESECEPRQEQEFSLQVEQGSYLSLGDELVCLIDPRVNMTEVQDLLRENLKELSESLNHDEPIARLHQKQSDLRLVNGQHEALDFEGPVIKQRTDLQHDKELNESLNLEEPVVEVDKVREQLSKKSNQSLGLKKPVVEVEQAREHRLENALSEYFNFEEPTVEAEQERNRRIQKLEEELREYLNLGEPLVKVEQAREPLQNESSASLNTSEPFVKIEQDVLGSYGTGFLRQTSAKSHLSSPMTNDSLGSVLTRNGSGLPTKCLVSGARTVGLDSSATSTLGSLTSLDSTPTVTSTDSTQITTSMHSAEPVATQTSTSMESARTVTIQGPPTRQGPTKTIANSLGSFERKGLNASLNMLYLMTPPKTYKDAPNTAGIMLPPPPFFINESLDDHDKDEGTERKLSLNFSYKGQRQTLTRTYPFKPAPVNQTLQTVVKRSSPSGPVPKPVIGRQQSSILQKELTALRNQTPVSTLELVKERKTAIATQVPCKQRKQASVHVLTEQPCKQRTPSSVSTTQPCRQQMQSAVSTKQQSVRRTQSSASTEQQSVQSKPPANSGAESAAQNKQSLFTVFKQKLYSKPRHRRSKVKNQVMGLGNKSERHAAYFGQASEQGYRRRCLDMCTCCCDASSGPSGTGLSQVEANTLKKRESTIQMGRTVKRPCIIPCWSYSSDDVDRDHGEMNMAFVNSPRDQSLNTAFLAYKDVQC